MINKSNPISYRFENSLNMRYYRVMLTKDLFEQWVVVKSWGGINKAGGRVLTVPCHSYDEALNLIEKLNCLRLKRGYQLCDRGS